VHRSVEIAILSNKNRRSTLARVFLIKEILNLSVCSFIILGSASKVSIYNLFLKHCSQFQQIGLCWTHESNDQFEISYSIKLNAKYSTKLWYLKWTTNPLCYIFIQIAYCGSQSPPGVWSVTLAKRDWSIKRGLQLVLDVFIQFSTI